MKVSKIRSLLIACLIVIPCVSQTYDHDIFTHYFEKSNGDAILVPEKFLHLPAYTDHWFLQSCPEGLYFNCAKAICTAIYDEPCNCVKIHFGLPIN